MSKQTACKLVLWALRLSSDNYTIEYITGMANLWADLMTRWAAPLARMRLSRVFIAHLPPALCPDFIWPTESEINDLQRDSDLFDPECVTRSEPTALMKTNEGSVWIPGTAVDMQIRLCIVAHYGRGGHRGASTTCTVLARYFPWSTLGKDCAQFCRSCLHCLSATGGLRTPRPLGEAIHAERPNQVLHFYFLFMGLATTGQKYILILKDDFS
jgi:Integrase zinc binding domain